MLNRRKPHLNRFSTIHLVKNYGEILKIWRHKEKIANESVPIFKPVGPSSPCKTVGPSSPCKTVKNSNISDNQLNTAQENPNDPIKKLKLSKLSNVTKTAKLSLLVSDLRWQTKSIFLEVNVQSSKWLFVAYHKPPIQNEEFFVSNLSKTIDSFSTKYVNILLM